MNNLIWEETQDNGHRRVFRVEIEPPPQTTPEVFPEISLHLSREFFDTNGVVIAMSMTGSLRLTSEDITADEKLTELTATLTSTLQQIANIAASREAASKETA